jgi:DNA-binding SARP family transcriptional activator
VEIRLLGSLEVREGEHVLDVRRRQQRALLAALALRAGEVVSTDRLIVDLWGERAPASATGSLQNTVSALRKTLGRDVLVTQPPGYRLAVEPEDVDANRFERLLAQALDAEPARRASLLQEALALSGTGLPSPTSTRRSSPGTSAPGWTSCESRPSRSGSTRSSSSAVTSRSSASSRASSPSTRCESGSAAS